MRRADAAERYFFARSYFDAVLAFERSWLLVGQRGGEVGAAAIAAVSDGVLHYYLGGTADAARDASPFKNVVAAMLDLADELELPLNLGGGVTAGDGLEEFKRGFANAELPFRTHEVVCDPAGVRAARRRPRRGRLLPGVPGRLSERVRREGREPLQRGSTPPPGGVVIGGSPGPPDSSIRAWILRRRPTISRSSASPGQAVSRVSPWPMTLFSRTRRPAG